MDMKFRSKHLENGNIRYIPLQQSKYSDDSDEDSSSIPLRTKQELPTINVDVDADDTLQAISIKFHCTIAELKRVNNILRDNEIYARRTIRVPIRPNSILTEQIVGVHISGSSSPITKGGNISLLDIDTETFEEKLKQSTTCNSNDSTNNITSSSSSDLITINHLLNNTKVNEVQASIEQQQQQDHTFLTNDENHVIVEPLNNKSLVHTLLSSGDDCGMSWLALVILVIILGFVCPLIYILYIAEHPEKYHHH